MKYRDISIGSEIKSFLYKKDSKGKIRQLLVASINGSLIQESGLLHGKMVRHIKACKPKNIGRSNETTSFEQAIAQAKAKISEKLRSGYFETIDQAKNEVVILPMLAKSFKPEEKKIDWKYAWGQPKFDGQRCLAKYEWEGTLVVYLFSRTGKPITTMPHIVNELVALNLPVGTILDGELYAHGLSFQENMRLIKKNRGDDSLQIKYHVYDTVLDQPFIYRHNVVDSMVTKYATIHIVPVETIRVTSKLNLRLYHEKVVSLGYEGTMLRWGNESYKINGRSSHLLKNKDFIDISIPLMDVEPSDARPGQGVPVFEWPGALNNEIRSGIKGSHKFREELLTNKQNHIGKMVELRFFEYSEDGVPRFPVMVGFRNDK